MKRRSTFLTFILVFIASLLFACVKKGGVNTDKIDLVVGEGGEALVITVNEGAVEDGTTLLTVMEELKKEEKFSFSVMNGMITEINGKANAADFNPCWMLYTSDEGMASSAWGTYSYEKEALGSATLGADALTVKEGEFYVWVYQDF